MKKFVFIALSCGLLYGYNVKIKKADVKLSINGNIKEFKKGDKLKVKKGDKLCYISGKGYAQISISDFLIKLSKFSKNKCKTIKGTSEKKEVTVVDNGKEVVNNNLSETEEEIKPGVSLQSSELNPEDIEVVPQ